MSERLQIRDLSVRMGERPVLERISLSAIAPLHLFVMGNNGAGKSTLLRALLKIVPLTEGWASIGERRLESIGQRELARTVAYVPQQASVALDWKAGDFMMMSRYAWLDPLEPPRESDRRAVREALELCECSAFEGRSLGELSGGERQRVLIAAALAQGGEILLLDEPTAFLDPRHQFEVQDLLARLRDERSLLIVTATHDLNWCWRADRIVGLKQGRLCFDGGPEEFLEPARLEALYDTPLRVVRDPSGRPVVLR